MPESPSLTLSEGPLLRHLSPGSTTVNLSTSRSGILRTPSKVLTHIHQTPIHLSTNTSSSIITLIGALNRLTIITTPYKLLHHTLPPPRLTTPIKLIYQTDVLIIHDARNTNATFNILQHPFPRVPPTHLSKLFQALQTLAEVTHTNSLNNTNIDHIITSYNTYFTNTPCLVHTPTITSTPLSPTPQQPPPLIGSIVYLNITLNRSPKDWYITANIIPTTHHSSVLQHPRGGTYTTTTQPVQPVVSLPFPLRSHGPLNISINLLFHTTTIPLSTYTLDILNFSQPVKSPLQDSSYKQFNLPQLNTPKLPNSINIPLHLPPNPPLLPTGAFSTVLKGAFEISKSGNVLIIHAPPHIAPFVRAALLRRVLRHLPESHKHTSLPQHSLQELDNWLPAFRHAETALVNCVNLFRGIAEGNLEPCYDRQEHIAASDAVNAVAVCYKRLRQIDLLRGIASV